MSERLGTAALVWFVFVLLIYKGLRGLKKERIYATVLFLYYKFYQFGFFSFFDSIRVLRSDIFSIYKAFSPFLTGIFLGQKKKKESPKELSHSHVKAVILSPFSQWNRA